MLMSTVLIFGSKGYVGTYFRSVYPNAITPSIDIGNKTAVEQCLDEHKPDIVINAAGRTGRPNVDWCETHKAETLYGNVTAPLVLLHACMERSLYLVQISTGCIYAGDNNGAGFSETDAPNFVGSFYSQTKKWLEEICLQFPVFLPRLRVPFDGTHSERNVISKLKGYNQVLDAQNSMTYMPDFVQTVAAMAEQAYIGPLNIVNPGTMSAVDIMNLYTELVDTTHTFTEISAADLEQQTAAPRSNCYLSGAKLESVGVQLPTVQSRMKEALTEYRG